MALAYYATTRIYYNNVLAYNIGDLVPDANVTAYGYLTSGWVTQLTVPNPPPASTAVTLLDTATASATFAPISTTLTQAAATAMVDPAIGRLCAIGHSYVEGNAGLTASSRRFSSVLATSTHAEDYNIGKGGSVSAAAETDTFAGSFGTGFGPGGYATTFYAVTPLTTADQPFADTYVDMSGLNDLFTEATVANAVAYAKEALRAKVARCRAGQIYENDSATFTYSAGWTANIGAPGTWSGGTSHSTTTVGATITHALPSTFVGGEYGLIFNVTGGLGASVSVTVDGGTASTFDFRTLGSTGRHIPYLARLTGLAAGAHTIIVTVTAFASSGVCYFDHALTAARNLPAVVLCNQPALPASFPNAGAAHTPVTSADITLLNAAISAVCTEFGTGVVLADIATAFTTVPGILFSGDNVHPSNAGQDLIARTILDAIASVGLGLSARTRVTFGGTPTLPRLFGAIGDTTSAYQNGWAGGNVGGWSQGGWNKTGDRVQLAGLIRKTAAVTQGEVIVNLPQGARTTHNREFICSAPGGTGTKQAVLEVTTAGALVWISGDNTGYVALDGISYRADG